jgi:hypothetical protein
MSTIKLELVPDALSRPIAEPGWRPLAIAKTAGARVGQRSQGYRDARDLDCCLLVPIALAIAIVVLAVRLVWTLIRRWRGR